MRYRGGVRGNTNWVRRPEFAGQAFRYTHRACMFLNEVWVADKDVGQAWGEQTGRWLEIHWSCEPQLLPVEEATMWWLAR